MKKIYCVRDLKADAFRFPHFSLTHGDALREFGDNVNNQRSPFYLHPEDYQLFYIGTFDEETGRLVGVDLPLFLASALEYSKKAFSDAEKLKEVDILSDPDIKEKLENANHR